MDASSSAQTSAAAAVPAGRGDAQLRQFWLGCGPEHVVARSNHRQWGHRGQSVHFLRRGRFWRTSDPATAGDEGKWTFDPETATLTLRWDKWAREVCSSPDGGLTFDLEHRFDKEFVAQDGDSFAPREGFFDLRVSDEPEPPSALPRCLRECSAGSLQTIIFHDAENCPIGRQHSALPCGDYAYQLHRRLMNLLKQSGGGEQAVWNLFLHPTKANPYHPSPQTLEELTTVLGVDLIDPGSKQDAVDMKMKAKISQFVAMHSHEPERFLLCFLTGDKDFMTEIRAAQTAGFRTVVLHPGQASRAFIRQAEECGGVVYDWTSVRVAANGPDNKKLGSFRGKVRTRVAPQQQVPAQHDGGATLMERLGLGAPVAVPQTFAAPATTCAVKVCDGPCGRTLTESHFSKTQWLQGSHKGQWAGKHRCRECCSPPCAAGTARSRTDSSSSAASTSSSMSGASTPPTFPNQEDGETWLDGEVCYVKPDRTCAWVSGVDDSGTKRKAFVKGDLLPAELPFKAKVRYVQRVQPKPIGNPATTWHPIVTKLQVLPTAARVPKNTTAVVGNHKYHCPDCQKQFAKWSICLQHLQAANHASANMSRKGLQQRCMLGQAQAAVKTPLAADSTPVVTCTTTRSAEEQAVDLLGLHVPPPQSHGLSALSRQDSDSLLQVWKAHQQQAPPPPPPPHEDVPGAKDDDGALFFDGQDKETATTVPGSFRTNPPPCGASIMDADLLRLSELQSAPSMLRDGATTARKHAPIAVGDEMVYTQRDGTQVCVIVANVNLNVPLGEDPEVSVRMPCGSVRETVLARLSPVVGAPATDLLISPQLPEPPDDLLRMWALQ